jgi:hypothetical protein
LVGKDRVLYGREYPIIDERLLDRSNYLVLRPNFLMASSSFKTESFSESTFSLRVENSRLVAILSRFVGLMVTSSSPVALKSWGVHILWLA